MNMKKSNNFIIMVLTICALAYVGNLNSGVAEQSISMTGLTKKTVTRHIAEASDDLRVVSDQTFKNYRANLRLLYYGSGALIVKAFIKDRSNVYRSFFFFCENEVLTESTNYRCASSTGNGVINFRISEDFKTLTLSPYRLVWHENESPDQVGESIDMTLNVSQVLDLDRSRID